MNATAPHRTTRAIRIERLGPPEVLVERDIPLPDPGPDDVQLRVRAAGVNFADLLMRTGLYSTVPPRPFSAGFEVAGEVVQVGAGVSSWRAGDRAAALLRYGGQARDVIVPATQLFRYPDALSPVQAAAIPVVYLTAWVALFEAARVRAGETALILGAAGGVGTAATQLAVRHGLRVIGTAGHPRKREFVVRELGAAACFDSRSDWEPEVRRFAGARSIDVALDAVGGRASAACQRLLAPLGRHVFYGLSDAMPGAGRNWIRAGLAWLRTPSVRPLSLIERNTGIFGIHLLHLLSREEILRSALVEIYRLVAAGELKPVIDRTFPLTQGGAVEAHHYLHARKNTGKVVLEVAEATEEQPAWSAR
jgi:NADPH:quinone reductase-like Zn-dependent oxidoreductase